MAMKLLLTGSDGFVGSLLKRERPCVPLIDDGGNVDLRDADRLRRAVARIAPDAVIHLAAQSFVPESFARPRETYEINFFGTLNLLEALKAASFAGRFLFVGSGDSYGLVAPDELPIDEAQPLRPRSPYAVSKAAAEALCYQWSQSEAFAIVMTRSFNHIGPGQSERFVVSDFARQVVEIRKGIRPPLIRTGDIDVTRDFTDVRDVVEAYLLLIEQGRGGEVYNVCSGSEQSIRDVLMRLLQLAGVEAAVEQDPLRLRRAEQRRICGSPRKLERDTGWTRRHSLDTSLADILNDWEAKVS
jgi:GDP-4-dehydro-6-deoxy-D-mannose reductase